MKITEMGGKVPVPFVDVDNIDLSVQWGALIHGKIVGEIIFIKPTVNFVASGDTSSSQYGSDTDRTKPIKDLIPMQINRLAIKDGNIVYHDFGSNTNNDVSFKDLEDHK